MAEQHLIGFNYSSKHHPSKPYGPVVISVVSIKNYY